MKLCRIPWIVVRCNPAADHARSYGATTAYEASAADKGKWKVAMGTLNILKPWEGEGGAEGMTLTIEPAVIPFDCSCWDPFNQSCEP